MNSSETISSSKSINQLLHNISQVPIETAVATLRSLLNGYIGLSNFSIKQIGSIKEKKATFTSSEVNKITKQDDWKYAGVLKEKFKNFSDMRFDVTDDEYKKITLSGKDEKTINKYLSLRFHIENINNFLDLLCFRAVLIQISSALTQGQYSFLTNDLAKTVKKLLSYLDGLKYHRMDDINQIFENNLLNFMKEFFVEITQNDGACIEKEIEKDKTEIKKYLDLFEEPRKLQTITGQNEYPNNVDKLPDQQSILVDSATLGGTGRTILWSKLEFYHYLYDRENRRKSNTHNLADKLRNLFVKFDELFLDHPHRIEEYLKQVYKVIYKEFPEALVKEKIDLLDSKIQIQLLSETDLRWLPTALLSVVADYISYYHAEKRIKPLISSMHISNSIFLHMPKEECSTKISHIVNTH